MFIKRRRALIKSVMESGCNVVCAATPQNLFYVTGFWGDGTAVIDQDETTLFTNSLEGERAKLFARNCDVIVSEIGKSLRKMVLDNISTKGKVCFDGVQLPLQIAIKKVLKKDVIFNPDIFYSIRRIKDETEISALARAGQIMDGLLSYALSLIRPKVSERELAAELLSKAISRGCDIPSSPTTQNPIIVASGPNSSFPHGNLTDRKFSEGDIVIIDIVIRFEGYIVDTTRTFAVGKVKDEIKDAYEAVKSAQNKGIKVIKPSVLTGYVDEKVRGTIDEKGYSQFFIHSTGHGVGLDVHESPSLKIGGKEVLQKKEVVTVEPGIYMPNKFGIRIEDTVLVSDKTVPFTKFSKEFLTLG